MVTQRDNKRLIEVDFPIKEVSAESVRDKNIRHGHISTLHIWWARRPLAASRATVYAALVPAPKDREELRRKLEFIAELCRWENSLNKRLLDKARREIREFFGGRAPKVLDCFAGSGSIPLEALRLGCETYALEYNPVAVLILKAVLEYPQKYGKRNEDKGGLNFPVNPLLEDVKKWGNWVLEEAKKEIGRFYPHDPDGSIPVGYIWARTIKCQNPRCNAEIPLMRQFWLAKKKNRKIALKPIIDRERKRIKFKIVKDDEIDFEPSQGTVKKAKVRCPVCGTGIDDNTVRKLFQEGKASQRMVAVVLYKPGQRGKRYRIVTKKDIEIFKEAEEYLRKKVENLRIKWGIEPIPDEPTPEGKGPGAERALSIRNYGLNTWGDLFNSRQKLTLITFVDKVREAYYRMVEQGYDKKYAKVVVGYLGLGVSMTAAFTNSLARWENTSEAIKQLYSRQALSILWDYVETNPFSGSSGSWMNGLRYYLNVLYHLSQIPLEKKNDPAIPSVLQSSATRLPYSNNYFDAVLTDPPYYDNVPYSYLSDFFYVWLKRIMADLYPELFATPLTPKSKEIVAYTYNRSWEEAKRFFEGMITQAFREIYRVLKPNGIAVIVFAHKSTEAWEAIINSLLNSGLVLTASWPIHTEMKSRLRAKESAALASSIYMVCRKRTKEEVAYFKDIKKELEKRIKEKLDQFWEQGISGSDFFVSAIGPAVEVFGRYSRVERLTGEPVSVKELLEYVRKVVSEYTLKRVLEETDLSGVDLETRFYLLWRWTFGTGKVQFGDAINLSRPMGVELTKLWDKGGLVKKEKEFVRVLGPIERAKDEVFMRRKPRTMIDTLHKALILWERGERNIIKKLLEDTGYAGNETFWRVAQALSEILPKGEKEKQLLQGFLSGKETYTKEAQKQSRNLLQYMGGRTE